MEANHNVSAPYGRITLHVFWELNYDFLPNYCYNVSTNRYVKMRNLPPMSGPAQRERPPQITPQYVFGSKSLNVCFGNISNLLGNFVGTQHFQAIVRLLGYQGIAVVLEELINKCQALITGPLAQLMRSVHSVMPKVCKLPRYDYGSPGVLSYYHAQLKDVIAHDGIRSDMFQAFRELGNAVSFSWLIEQAMAQEEVLDLLHAAPFTNVIPRPFLKEGEKIESRMAKLEAKYAKIQICEVIEHLGTARQAAKARNAKVLTNERLTSGLTLFEVILTRIGEAMGEDSLWHGLQPANGVLNVDECSEFHRVWSAIQFVFLTPAQSDTEATVESVFGEGLQWGGLALIALLGQERRFNALDFTYHLLKVQRLDGKDDNIRGVMVLSSEVVGEGLQWGGLALIALLGQERRFNALDFTYHLLKVQRLDGKDDNIRGVMLSRMVERIRRFQMLNNQILAILTKHLKHSAEGQEGAGVPVEHVRCFQPPIHHALAKTLPH